MERWLTNDAACDRESDEKYRDGSVERLEAGSNAAPLALARPVKKNNKKRKPGWGRVSALGQGT